MALSGPVPRLESVQRVADIVVERGLAEYRDNPAHRRAKLLAPTGEGRAAVDRIDRAGPRGRIVKRRARRRGQRDGRLGPVDQVFRRGVADGDIEMPQLGIAERARGLEKEHMIGAAVIGEPEIPDPRVSQSQHGAPFRPEARP